MTEEIKGYEVLERTVKPFGTGAGVHLPRKWIGTVVKVVRTEEIPDD